MKILLTNDDGYNSKGILLLREKLKKYGEVTILAPYTHMSAKSVSLILDRGCKLYKIMEDYYAFDGTPADCVSFALTSLNEDFDLVVSGCNDGPNISFDTMYSGTIGACVQAATMNKRAIAFSQSGDFSLVDKYFDKVMQYILDNNLISDEYILNVNFPNGTKVNDIQVGRQEHINYDYFFISHAEEYFAKRKSLPTNYDSDTDVYMFLNDIVSITPLNVNLFTLDTYKKVKDKIK